MYHEQNQIWKPLMEAGFEEDGLPWDWTTLGTRKSPEQILSAKIIAKSEGIWAAQGLVASLNCLTPQMQIQDRVRDGEKVKPESVLVEIREKASDLLAIERPFLNLAAYASGIATLTRRLVDKVKELCPKNPPRITLTRKTLPHYRDVSIHSVRIGGGHPHRVGLSSGILIKENHIAMAGGIHAALNQIRQVAPHGLRIEIEVRNLQELKEATQIGADGVLLDNFSPSEVKKALELVKSLKYRPLVEISGGISEGNIASYAIEGVDVISVGALTHSARSLDLSFLMDH